MTPTISWYELIWTIGAIPGLLLWMWNWKGAASSLRAIRTLKTGNGRLLWARFSTLMTSVFVGVELVFVLLGVISMFRPEPATTQLTVAVWVMAFGLMGASVAISFLAYQWRVVDQAIIGQAKRRDIARRATDVQLQVERHRPPPPDPEPLDTALQDERRFTNWRSDTDPGTRKAHL